MQFNKKPLQIQAIIDLLGEDKARAYYQQLFAKPESLIQFASLFQNYTTDAMPEFHQEMLGLVLEGMFIDKSKGTRFCYSAPRGFAKSTVFNVIFTAWVALNGYYNFIIPISDTHDQAKLHLNALKSELESNSLLQWIYPNLQAETWAEERIIVNGLKGQVLILPRGAGMKIRGLRFKQFRPQLLIIDDLENTELVYSEDRRRKLKNWFDKDLEPAMDRYEKNIIFIGTVLHRESLLNKVLNKEEKYQSWITKKYQALSNDGVSLWHARFPAEYLIAIRDDPTNPDYVGSIVFAQEYQNNPQDDSFSVIKTEWVKNYSMNEAIIIQEGATHEEKFNNYLSSFTEIYAGVDPAISETDQADNFSMYIAGLEKTTSIERMLGLIHTKEANINMQVNLICDAIQKYKIQLLGIESIAYQKGLATLVKAEANRRALYLSIKEIKTDKDKVRRAKIHSSGFEAGLIYLNRDDEKYNIIFNEIVEFPMAKHDDAFDSLMLARETRQSGQGTARVFRNKPKPF